MDPLAPKPFGASKPAFKGFQGRGVPAPEKSQTLPIGMPGLSGDILKQRIKTMHKKDKSPETKPDLQRAGSVGKSTAPAFSQKDILNRRDSMNKAPPPPPPNGNKNVNKTPEFLRKKLKPTGKVLAKSDEKSDIKENLINKEKRANEKEEEDGKSNFRKSRLMFEQTPPVIAPKPRALSKSSGEPSQETKEIVDDNHANINEQKEISGENIVEIETVSEDAVTSEAIGTAVKTDTENIAKQFDSNDENDVEGDLAAGVKTNDQNTEQIWPKPINFELPEVPKGLSKWLDNFVRNNKNLIKIDSETRQDVPPLVLRELKNISNNTNGNAEVVQEINEANEEIYDDVQTGQNEEEEVYDDVDGMKQTGLTNSGDLENDTAGTTSEEIYDDVDNTSAPVIEEELYDDVTTNAQPGGEEVYDDVGMTQMTGVAPDELDYNEMQGEDLYEPVETIVTYMSSSSTTKQEVNKSDSLQSNGSQDKVSKKKEEKERKEREKLEKKRKEEAEKKFKKEEEERKKKEKEEKKRIEKERKSFNLKPEEDPVPIERHMAKCDIKAKGKDLAFCRGEYLDIISKNNCPKGKVLAQNCLGKLGYVCLKDLGIDKRKSLLETSSPVALGVAFGEEFYEEVNNQSDGLIVSLSSPKPNDSPLFQTSLSHFKQSAQSSPASSREENKQSDEGDPGEEIYELVS